MLKVENISAGYNQIPLLSSISFKVEKGQFIGILGPNGSGKSTLLKVMSGIIKPISGNVLIEGRDIKDYSSKQLAKKMTILPQLQVSSFSSTVRETVSVGRYPHQVGFFSSWSEEDEKAVSVAMEQTSVGKFSHQQLEFLSGGERQRVYIAQALAQTTSLLLLDEPTNHLDIAHQKQILDMIRKEVTERGLTVVSVFHDINLASLYCDELLLLAHGQVKAMGEPHEVLIESLLREVYEAPLSLQAHPEQPKPQMAILPEYVQEATEKSITKYNIQITNESVILQSPFPLKILSSAVHNAGLGWYSNIVNRRVELDYNVKEVKEEYVQYLITKGFATTNTVGMMTAVDPKKAIIKQYNATFGEVLIMVTAGIGNAIDVSLAYKRERSIQIGTINTWIVVNGKLSDEAFVQLMMTATEAKAKALFHEEVIDPITCTIATGTPTDSLLIAATQQGEMLPYGGTITEVGKIIGRGVFEATVEAIQMNRKGDLK